MQTIAQWPIRIRRTVEPTGEIAAARSVFCRALERSLDLAECEGCPQFAGVTDDDRGRATHVRCLRALAPARAATRDAPATAAEATPLSSVMTPAVWCVAPGLAAAEAAALLAERNIGGAPVVDREGFPVGVLTRADLADLAGDLTVADRMSPVAFTLDERAPLACAAALMAVEGVHHLPVVADDGRVVGIVSTLDVTTWVARQAGYSV